MKRMTAIGCWLLTVWVAGILAVHAESVTNNLDVQGGFVYGHGAILPDDSGLTFTNAGVRDITVSVGQLSGVDPEDGSVITNSANLLPLKAQSLETTGDITVGGTLTGDGSGLTDLNAGEITSGSISASSLPSSGTWNATGVTVSNLNIEGDLDMGGFKIKNLGSAVGDADAASQGRVKTMMQQVPEYGDLSMGAFTSQAGMPDRSVPAIIGTDDIANGAITANKLDAEALDSWINSPFQEYTAIKSVSGAYALTFTDGNNVKLVLTGDCVIGFDSTYPTNGVNRVSVDFYADGHSITFDSSVSDPKSLVSSGTVTPVRFRKSGGETWAGRKEPCPFVKGLGGEIVEYTQNGKSYTAHIFTSSGTFYPNGAKECDLLIVAGGGGGGSNEGGSYDAGGGGGSGGMVVLMGETISIAKTITVGAGGVSDCNGEDSSVAGFTVAEGGGAGGAGAGQYGDAGDDGGCGGGGGYGQGNGADGGAGSQGGDGAGSSLGSKRGGGGGGAGGNGASNGTGGVGISNSFSGSSVIYAEGGRGAYTTDTSGTTGGDNTGRGGDGSGAGSGYSGGSGIVIVRYLNTSE